MTNRQEHLLRLLADPYNSSTRMGRGDHEAIQAAIDEIASLTARIAAMETERNRLRVALQNMLSGWRSIREVHGDLYGVGWDPAEALARDVLDTRTP